MATSKKYIMPMIMYPFFLSNLYLDNFFYSVLMPKIGLLFETLKNHFKPRKLRKMTKEIFLTITSPTLPPLKVNLKLRKKINKQKYSNS